MVQKKDPVVVGKELDFIVEKEGRLFMLRECF